MSVDPTYMHNATPPPSTQPALRVWLVEDDASIRWVLERALRASGMVPRAFDSAEPAMAALRADAPDVLLTDIRMPGSSGIDLLREVRVAHPTLPVIVMTAHSDLPSAVSAASRVRRPTSIRSERSDTVGASTRRRSMLTRAASASSSNRSLRELSAPA